MRSRYSAWALGETAYLRETWHSLHRPDDFSADPRSLWLGLEVLASAEDENRARVEFEARFLCDGRVDAIHENSDFVFEDGRWLYTRGEQLAPRFKPWKPGRNEDCPCGSGRKFKRCCGSD